MLLPILIQLYELLHLFLLLYFLAMGISCKRKLSSKTKLTSTFLFDKPSRQIFNVPELQIGTKKTTLLLSAKVTFREMFSPLPLHCSCDQNYIFPVSTSFGYCWKKSGISIIGLLSQTNHSSTDVQLYGLDLIYLPSYSSGKAVFVVHSLHRHFIQPAANSFILDTDI